MQLEPIKSPLTFIAGNSFRYEHLKWINFITLVLNIERMTGMGGEGMDGVRREQKKKKKKRNATMPQATSRNVLFALLSHS